MTTRGIVYIAYGKAAIGQFHVALQHLHRRAHWPIAVVSDERIPQIQRGLPFRVIPFECPDPGARWAKVNLDSLTPFDHTLYLDADTRVRGDLSPIWDVLDDGWEMAFTPCGTKTRISAMKHIITYEAGGLAEKNATFAECGGWPFIGWQGGVMAWRDCDRVRQFFAAWREEWQRWRGQDQGALVRAYRRAPARTFALGRAFNGGVLVGHYHSHARRRGMIGSIAE